MEITPKEAKIEFGIKYRSTPKKTKDRIRLIAQKFKEIYWDINFIYTPSFLVISIFLEANYQLIYPTILSLAIFALSLDYIYILLKIMKDLLICTRVYLLVNLQ